MGKYNEQEIENLISSAKLLVESWDGLDSETPTGITMYNLRKAVESVLTNEVSRTSDKKTTDDGVGLSSGPMTVYVDIDETICFYEGKREYQNAVPHMENISKINRLFDEGHFITYWTARGAISKKNWMELTEKQLSDWGCKHHRLIVGEKPHYDLLICDKTKRIEEI